MMFTFHSKKLLTPNRATFAKAKYGDESIYFDLDDMPNTIGNWDMYGQDGDKRYPAMQAEFFSRAGKGLSRRESMLAFCALSGSSALLIWGLKGSSDAKLPIIAGPQKPPQVGPRGRI